ncbi:MAG: HlyD family secretion protein [Gammaproteobacteria bacterium]
MNKRISLLIGFIIFILLALIVSSFWQAYKPATQRLQGQIEAREYSISSKVPGRIDKVFVKKGEQIKQGHLIFTLLSPELVAKLEQAKAGSKAANAMADAADKGARRQQLAAAKDSWKKAKVAAQLAEKTAERISNLFKDGVLSEQKKDEAQAQLKAARLTESSAYQMYEMTKEGTRSETITAAKEKARAAREVVSEVKAYSDETQINSWHDGEVSQVLLRSGEIAPAGFPVVNIIDMQDVWAILHVREDQLAQYKKGTEFIAVIPAIGETHHKFKVTYVSVMGDYATWRATDTAKGFDMRTFEVEARPIKAIENLRVGMSILVQP